MFFEFADYAAINEKDRTYSLSIQDLKTELFLMSVFTEHSDSTAHSYWVFMNQKSL